MTGQRAIVGGEPDGDRGSGAPPLPPAGPRSREDVLPGPLAPSHRGLTVAIVTTVLLVAFEALAVGTVMPRAVAQLDGVRHYALAFSGFLTASLFGMVAAGELCDRRGPTRPVLFGAGSFCLGLLVAGSADGMATFLVGRALQGIGGGAVVVGLYVVVARAYPERVRPRVFSAMSAGWVIPSVVGPLVAGFVADTVGWRWVFLGIVVLALPAVVAMAPRLPGLDRPSAGGRGWGRLRLGLGAALGAALLQLALQTAAGGAVTTGHGGGGVASGAGALTALVVGGSLLVLAVPRLLPAGTLRARRGLPTVVLVRGLLAGAFFGAEAFLPLMLVRVDGFGLTAAGATLTTGALGWAVGSWWQGRPGLSTPRWKLVRGGCLLVGIGTTVCALTLLPGVPAWGVLAGWAVGGLGMGWAMGSVSVLAMRLAAPEEQGAVSSSLQVCEAVFTTTSTGVAGAAFAALHARSEMAVVFALILAGMVVVAAVGAVVASRIRTR